MNPSITALAGQLRAALERWKSLGLIQFAPPAPSGFASQKNRAIRRAEQTATSGMSKHDARRLQGLTAEQRAEHRRAYRRNWFRQRRANRLAAAIHCEVK